MGAVRTAEAAVQRPLSMSYLSAPMRTPELSVEVAAAAGFQHVGLRLGPVMPGDSPSLMIGNSALEAACRKRLDDHGMSVIEVEGFTIVGGFDARGHLPVIEAAARLGTPTLLAVADLRGRIALDEVIGHVGRLQALAAGYGLRVAFEPIAHRVGGSLQDALRVATETGAGLALDMLHLDRMGVTPDQAAAVDRRRIYAIHLCDAPTAPKDLAMMIRHSASERALPGEGVLPVRAYLEALPADLPLSVEIPQEHKRDAGTPLTRAKQCYDATRAYLAEMSR